MIRILSLCGVMAFAAAVSVASADQNVKHDDWAGGASDLLGATKVNLDGEEAPPARQVTLACTDENGTRLKKGDAGYDDCVRRANQQQQHRQSLQSGN